MRSLHFALCLALCMACTSAKNTLVPQSMDKMDTIKPAVEKLTDEERGLFTGYLMRHTIGAALGSAFGVKQDGIPAGMTIGKAIAEQKEFVAKQEGEAAAAKVAAKKAEETRKALAAQMAQVLTVSLKSISLHKATFSSSFDVENYINFTLEVENKGGKGISGIKGTATFRDKFGDVVSSLPLKMEDEIKPGQKLVVKLQKKYNQFRADDQKLAGVDAATAKFELAPEVVLFSDGTKFEAPAAE